MSVVDGKKLTLNNTTLEYLNMHTYRTAVTVPTFMHSTALRVCIRVDHGHLPRTDFILLLLIARDQLQRASRYDKGYSFCIRPRSGQIGNVIPSVPGIYNTDFPTHPSIIHTHTTHADGQRQKQTLADYADGGFGSRLLTKHPDCTVRFFITSAEGGLWHEEILICFFSLQRG